MYSRLIVMPLGLRRLTPRVVVLLLAATLALTVVETTRADDQPPAPGSSGVIQYTELVPTAKGPKAPGVGKQTQATLPRKAKRALEKRGGATAAALETVATSSSYGAPTQQVPRKAEKAKKPARTTRPAVSNPTPARSLEGVATALGSVSEARLLGLLIALGTITVGAITVAFRRPARY